MNSPIVHPEAGFVLLDALMATALAGLAGSAIIMIADSMLAQQGRELDQSVALVMSQSLMRQYVLLNEAAPEREDELYRYEIVETGAVEDTSTLRAMAVVAEPKANSVRVRIDFLARATP